MDKKRSDMPGVVNFKPGADNFVLDRTAADRDPVLHLDQIRKDFRHPLTLRLQGGLRSVSLDVRPGETYGLLGPNGAGKTTTIKIILGLLRPTSGLGRLMGHPLGSLEARRSLGYLPENPYFYDYLTGREFLELCGTLSGMSGADRKQRIDELLESLELSGAGALPMRKYSKGMVQRVGLAQAILARPQFLLLDEPMSGLDPLGRRLVRDLVMQLKRAGTTILMSSHILPDVEHVCDRVGIMRRGELVRSLTLRDLAPGARGGGEIRVRTLPGALARSWPGNPSVEMGADTILFQLRDSSHLDPLLAALVEARAEVLSVQREQSSLEEIFFELFAPQSPSAFEERRAG